MDRRRFLSLGGRLALGLGAASLLPRRAWADPLADAQFAELVTVGCDSAVITLDSLQETEALVRFGPSPDQLDQQVADPKGETTYHRLELSGLQADEQVYYQIQVNGLAVDPNPYSPGVFTTLTPPQGPELFTFATITDLHVGLMSAGAVGGMSSYVPVECPLGQPTCWQVANRAVIQAINKAQPDFLIAKGDLTHEFRPEEFQAARELLDQLEMPWYAVRGNHDRQGDLPQDLFGDTFGLEKTHYSFEHRGVPFLVLDSSNLETGFQQISEEQWLWLEERLNEMDVHQVFFLVLHHAVSEEASVVFSLFAQDQQRLFKLLQRKKGLAGILSGHSHRNKVTHQAELGPVPCIETSTTVHYPGGYNLYRVHTDGYVQTYHKIDGHHWRIWEAAGRDMYKGDAQQILLGDIHDRNFVYSFPTPIPLPDSSKGGCASIPQAKNCQNMGTGLLLGSLAAGLHLARNKK